MHLLSLNCKARALARVVFSIGGWLSTCLLGSPAPNNQFTVEVVNPNTAPRTLIDSNASWRYFKGASDPNKGWDTADETFLGPVWKTNLAGFGYGDGDDRTLLNDMQNGYSTVYLRTTFKYAKVLDPRRLIFRIDYDDGFIAYLDGQEFARVNVPGEPGQALAASRLATASHEASRGPGGNLTETYYFGPAFPAAFPHAGEYSPLTQHVLAIQGLNQAIGDDDFSISPALYLENLFTEVATDSVQLAGRINILGASEVLINGAPAVLSSGTWSKIIKIRSGLNRLIIQAQDCDHQLLASLTKDVLTKGTPSFVSGTLSNNTVWDSATGVVELTGNVNVASGVALNICEGTTVLFRPGTSLSTTGGTINVNGASNNPVYLLPADGETPWDGITVSGGGSLLTLRYAEVVAGGIYMSDKAAAWLEDTIIRDFSYTSAGFEHYMVHALGNCHFNARRSVFSRYYTMAFGGKTTLQVEDCLFEYSEHDFIKPQDTTPDSYVRRCTFARSSVAGTDGVDTGANSFITLDNCLFYDISDKAISMEASTITVTNCLIYKVGTGVAVKDNSTATLINNTIVNATYGIAVYLKNAGAAFASAAVTNNIIWENKTNLTLRNPDDGSVSPNATVTVRYSDVGGGYPGTGNINRDPRFINAPNGDFRLAGGSPALGTGAGGVDMGAFYFAGASQSLVLLQQPMSQTAGRTSKLTLHVTAIGSPPIFYQWRFNNTDIPGATTASLEVSNLQAADEGSYQVWASNRISSVTSAPAMVLLDDPLRIHCATTAACRHNLRLTGPAGRRFILLASSNLVTWSAVYTNAAPTGIIEFNDVGMPSKRSSFYRAESVP